MNDKAKLVDHINQQHDDATAHHALADHMMEDGDAGAHVVRAAGDRQQTAGFGNGMNAWAYHANTPPGFTPGGYARAPHVAGGVLNQTYLTTHFGPHAVHVRKDPHVMDGLQTWMGHRPAVLDLGGSALASTAALTAQMVKARDAWDARFIAHHPKVLASVHVPGGKGGRHFLADAHPDNVETLAQDLPPLVAAHLRHAVRTAYPDRPTKLARVNVIGAGKKAGGEPGVQPWTGEKTEKPGVIKPDPIQTVPEVFGVTHYPSDGILHGSVHPGTGNVDREHAPAAWYERSAVHHVLDTSAAGAFSEADARAHVALIKKLFAEHPLLLGVAGERYKQEAEHLHHIVSKHADGSIKSSNAGSRPSSPVMEQLVERVRPLVVLANRLLVRAGKSRDMSTAVKPTVPAVPAADPHAGGEALDEAAKKKAEKQAKDADSFSIKPVDGRKVKTTVKAAAASERKAADDTADPTLVDDAAAIPLATGRWDTIHAMLRDGKDRKAVIAALQKAHGITKAQAAGTLSRFLSSEKARRELDREPRPGQPGFRLSRPVVDDYEGTHDRLVHQSKKDPTALLGLADWLHENGHPNARLIQAGAERQHLLKKWEEMPRDRTTHRGNAIWQDREHGTFREQRLSQRVGADANVGNYGDGKPLGSTPEIHTYWRSHVYSPYVLPDGTAIIELRHREAKSSRGGTGTSPGDFHEPAGTPGNQSGISVPILSRADLRFQTEHLPAHIRDHLTRELDPHLPETHEEPARLSRKSDQRVTAKELLAQGDPGHAMIHPAEGGAPARIAIGDVRHAAYGTSLGFHLNSLYHEHKASNPRISNLALAAMKNERVPGAVNTRKGAFQLLGEALKKAKHKKADLYDWASKDKTVTSDAWVQSAVKKLVGSGTGRFTHDRSEFWDHVREGIAGDAKHASHKKFWGTLWALAHKAGKDGKHDVKGINAGTAKRHEQTKHLGATLAEFKKNVLDALFRIGDQHLDRTYLASVARAEAKGATSRAANPGGAGTGDSRADWAHVFSEDGPMGWRKVMGRTPTGPARLNRSHES